MNSLSRLRLVCPVLLSLLAGCSGLRSQDPAVQTYLLQAGGAASVAATNRTATLAVSRPTAASGLDTERIAVVRGDGRLDWTAPPGAWTLHALFLGDHGKLVERAAPGGEGNVIDHFAVGPIRGYLRRFDEAFAGRPLDGLRAFFNDSYEVDDAAGESNWTPLLFDEFEKRRGYDLRRGDQRFLSSLDGEGDDGGDVINRVWCRYGSVGQVGTAFPK